MNTRKKKWVVSTSLGIGAMLGMMLCACPADTPSMQPELDAGTHGDSADARADAEDASEPWDPVWHETQPKAWSTVGPDGQPDCGPGCRIALNGKVSHPGYYGHASSSLGVGDVGGRKVMFALLGSSETRVVDAMEPPDVGFVEPFLFADRIVYAASYADSTRQIIVQSVVTGERKVVHSYKFQENKPDIALTALNSRFAFWIQPEVGTTVRDLQTGEARLLTQEDLPCARICTTDTALICPTGSRILSVDPGTGVQTRLAEGGAIQVDAACSADHSKIVWVDYRDPPGTNSDPDFARNGGEIYMMDLGSQQVQRLTFDSPTSPRGKTDPATDGRWVVWREAKPDAPVNPPTAQELYAAAQSLVVFDVENKTRCRIDSPRVQYLVYNSVYGRHVYGYYYFSAIDELRLVDIDLDDPSFECKTYL